jgi:APA family basic amino acid/polyamine antiporter
MEPALVSRTLGLKSGVGLVIANMIGAGVFLSTGFMAQALTPSQILLAWVIGAALALCGTVAYAEVARLVPEGGGEYRYLSSLLHPSLGYLAGWASLLVGFSAPIALDAMAAGAFARAVEPSLSPVLVGATLIIVLMVVHALGLHLSARVQNALVVVKVLLVLGFIAVGVAKGSLAFPTWEPPHPSTTPVSDLAFNLFFIAFAFSGWNAAIYAADDFKEPKRDVPRAMLFGCAVVAVLYLVLNYIFVANLTPAQGTVVFNYSDFSSLKGQFDQVTLGQAVMASLLGPTAARVMSGVMVLLFISATSAMMLVGPRVYSAMARDGFLPQVLAGQEGKPPVGAVVLQGAIALLLLLWSDVASVLGGVGELVVIFAALTMVGLFARVRAAQADQRPSIPSLIAAAVYVGSAAYMLFIGVKRNPIMSVVVLGVCVVGVGAWAVTRRKPKPA